MPRAETRLRRIVRGGAVFFVALAILLAIRFSLPYVVRGYVNRALSRLPDYAGTIGDVDVNLWRGAYSIDDVRLLKRNSGVDAPFFSAPKVDVSIEWRSLFRGALVGEVSFDRPHVVFVVGASEAESQTRIDEAWKKVLSRLVPFRINSCTVASGKLEWTDETKEPPVKLALDELDMVITNLTNIREPEETSDPDADRLVATVEATGRPLGHGRLWGEARIDPFAEFPTFDLDASVRDVEMRSLREFTRAFAGFDAEKGRFHVSAEFACADGRIVGYIAPFFEGLEIATTSEIEDVGDVFTFLWESVVGTAAEALENQPSDRVATKVPLEGRVEGPNSDVFATIGNLLVNAFIRAFTPGVEGTVTLEDAEAAQTGGERRERAEEATRRREAAAAPGREVE